VSRLSIFLFCLSSCSLLTIKLLSCLALLPSCHPLLDYVPHPLYSVLSTLTVIPRTPLHQCLSPMVSRIHYCCPSNWFFPLEPENIQFLSSFPLNHSLPLFWFTLRSLRLTLAPSPPLLFPSSFFVPDPKNSLYSIISLLFCSATSHQHFFFRRFSFPLFFLFFSFSCEVIRAFRLSVYSFDYVLSAR
jgi:hypothetical protein